MLLNNLDPEVAEKPEELIVYGGSGRAARSHDALRGLVRSLLELGMDETLLVQSGKPVGVFRTHPGAPRVLIANCAPGAEVGHLGRVSPARGRGSDDVRPNDGRELDLHRHSGDPPGHLPDVRRGGGEALRLARPRGTDDPDRGPRRDGRSPAIGGNHGRRRDPLHRGRPGADRAGGSRPATSTRRATRSTTRSRGCGRPRPDGRPLSVGVLGNAAEVIPELARRREHFDLVTDQTAAHDPLNGYVPIGALS